MSLRSLSALQFLKPRDLPSELLLDPIWPWRQTSVSCNLLTLQLGRECVLKFFSFSPAIICAPSWFVVSGQLGGLQVLPRVLLVSHDVIVW